MEDNIRKLLNSDNESCRIFADVVLSYGERSPYFKRVEIYVNDMGTADFNKFCEKIKKKEYSSLVDVLNDDMRFVYER